MRNEGHKRVEPGGFAKRSDRFSRAQVDAQMAFIEAERKVYELETENEKLRTLVKGLITCSNEDADARDCPFYDLDAPYRCTIELLLADLDLKEE